MLIVWQVQQVALVEKLITGKLVKQAFIDQVLTEPIKQDSSGQCCAQPVTVEVDINRLWEEKKIIGSGSWSKSVQ